MLTDFLSFLRQAPLGTFALDATGIFLVLLALLVTWSGIRFGKGLSFFIFGTGIVVLISGWPGAFENQWYLIGAVSALFLLTVLSARIFEREWKKKEWIGFIRQIARFNIAEGDSVKRKDRLQESMEKIRAF